MRMLRPAFAVAAAVLVIEATAACRRFASPDRPIAEVVDHYIDREPRRRLPSSRGPAADDRTLVRRLTLDLDGRIPTAAESLAYAAVDRSRQARPAGRPLDGVARLRPSPGDRARHHADGRRQRAACATISFRPSARTGPGTASSASSCCPTRPTRPRKRPRLISARDSRTWTGSPPTSARPSSASTSVAPSATTTRWCATGSKTIFME